MYTKSVEEEKEPLYKRIFQGISFVEVAIIGFVIVVLATVFQVVLNRNSQNSVSPAKSSNESLGPTPAPKTVTGDIVCVGISADGACEIGLKTDKGIYKIENASDSVMADFFASLGNSVELSGIVTTSQGGSGQSTANSQASNDSVGGPSSQTTITAGSSGSSSQSTSGDQTQQPVVGTITLVTTPTPTASGIFPFFGSDPTPTPTPSGNFSSDYGTVKYILDHKDELKGKIVDVSAYLIDGRVGNNFCAVINPCDHWELVLGDALTDDLENNYWIKVHISKSEKENDYEIGKKVTLKGKVTVVSTGTYLVKQY